MRAEIEFIISKLDQNQDLFLIDLLRQKLKIVPHYDVNITDREIKMAMKGIEQSVGNTLIKIIDENPIVQKIDKILKGSSCGTCDYSIENTHTAYGRVYDFPDSDDSNPVCISCERRCGLLRNQKKQIENQISFDAKTLDEDFIKTKALLNKISNKIKQVKQNN
jgi:hypothetical protein